MKNLRPTIIRSPGDGSMILIALDREWLWPATDTECWPVVFGWSPDLEIVYKHCRSFRSVVQAGGNMGVWPWLLAQKFQRVYTFEPDPRCFRYLVHNVANGPNISQKVWFSQSALGSERRHARIHHLPGEETNLGAQYTASVSSWEDFIPTTMIDDLRLSECDLIYLDIEGREMHALQGAVDTIQRTHPVIVVEDKGLSEKFGVKKGEIEKWLHLDFGYEVVARPHRFVVLVCNF
jgi:FkbM family methyltransferase